jgi:hypothetical protein
MKRMCTIGCLAAAIAAGGWLAGCEERIAYEREVDVDNGEVTTKETEVRRTPQGDLQVEERTREVEYDDGRIEKETTETETVPRR